MFDLKIRRTTDPIAGEGREIFRHTGPRIGLDAKLTSIVVALISQRLEFWRTRGLASFVCSLILAFSVTIVCSYPSRANALDDATKTRVRIDAGDVVLGATLFRPVGAGGEIPVLVTVHGSAPTTRDGVSFYTNLGLKMGFAVLSFDKRGTGESTGEYIPFCVEESESIFDGLASDIEYAVRWVSEQDGIDRERIGLFGGSQAGWLMPLAASREPLVKFIIVGEGTPLTAGQEAAHANSSGDGANEWSLRLIRDADEALESYQGDPGFDPTPHLKMIDVPTLWIFGLYDDVIPIMPSIDRLKHLIVNGKTNNAVHVLPFGDHNFSNSSTGQRYDIQPIIEAWLQAQEIR